MSAPAPAPASASASSGVVLADSSAPHCPYGVKCYRVNPQHKREMYHPQPAKKEFTPFPTPFIYVDEYGGGAPGNFDGPTRAPRTLRELQMMRIMGSIKEKPEWRNKIKDQTIAAKWVEEARAALNSTRAAQWCIDELKYEATIEKGPKQIESAAVQGAWQSDHLIPAALRDSLLSAFKRLESAPAETLDWHPGTNQQVLDLVHPSLYCYVIGKSRRTKEKFGVKEALSKFGMGEPEEKPAEKKAGDSDYWTSRRFAWLPADVTVGEDGAVTFDSYINNLHPVEHAELYPVLAGILKEFIPLFERVLTHLKDPTPLRIQSDIDWYERPADYVDENDEDKEKETSKSKNENDGDLDEEMNSKSKKNMEVEEEANDDEYDEDEYANRTIYLPDVSGPFNPHRRPADSVVTLAGRPLQVIVKMAEIVLTPSQPKYPGGSWHVEGMANEMIAATGIYYVSSTNISESRLAFRQACDEPSYEQSDDRGVGAVYGLANEEALSQDIGSVITQGDRAIAFPNIYQHQVQPFELADPTQEGRRRILVFFLCDPAVRVVSTSTVPPQQSHWFRSHSGSTEYDAPMRAATPLINDITKIVTEYVDPGIMTPEEAHKYREQLMEERKYFVAQNTETVYERPFSLCEH